MQSIHGCLIEYDGNSCLVRMVSVCMDIDVWRDVISC